MQYWADHLNISEPWSPLFTAYDVERRMNTYGLSMLEIKALIQRALLPDICHCEVTGDGYMEVTLVSSKNSACRVRLPRVRVDSLNSSRALAELIGEARYLLAANAVSARGGMDQNGLPKRARTRTA